MNEFLYSPLIISAYGTNKYKVNQQTGRYPDLEAKVC
jgi:hypothetical protein